MSVLSSEAYLFMIYGCILNVKSDCLTSKDVARIASMLSIKEYPLQIESNTLLLWIWHPLSMRWCTADEITLETLIQITQMHLRITSVTDIVASFIYFFLFRLQLPVFIRLPVCIIIRGTIANSSVAHIPNVYSFSIIKFTRLWKQPSSSQVMFDLFIRAVNFHRVVSFYSAYNNFRKHRRG